MASTKRDLPKVDETGSEQQQLEAKKARINNDDMKKHLVVLNPADCNLDFDIEDDGLRGSALCEQGFAYCWSGARANVGITGGKYCFGCKIISAQPVEMVDTPPCQQHVCRLGISKGGEEVGSLGESKNSFGFGGTGKFSNGGKFSDYGEKFGVGDTIVCAVDLESKPLASIGFAKNGKWLGTAMHFNSGPEGLGVVDTPLRKLPWESAVFPHVMLKNVVVQLQFSTDSGLVPQDGYKPWAAALEDGNVIVGPAFSELTDCEVMMMVGLPASGKTTWAEKWVKEHPEKRYVLLGTNLVLDQMKVPGLLRKRNYGERFDRLMGRANQIFDTLLSRAAKTPRNYVIDQTNVFKGARKRKLRPFVNFRKIAVVVFPNPEELERRATKGFEEMGKEVPVDALNNMIANYALPLSKETLGSDEFFDEVKFVELERGESRQYLDEMKRSVASAPYSRQTSVESSNSCSTVVGRHWQPNLDSAPPLLNSAYQMPNQVHSTYLGVQACSKGYQGYQVPQAAPPCGHSISVSRENAGSFGGYYRTPDAGSSHYDSTYNGINRVHGLCTSSYGSRMIEPSPVRSATISSFAYNSYVGQYNSGGGHQHAGFQSRRPPIFEQSPPPITYVGSPYSTPRHFSPDYRHSGRYPYP
ncbi:hypothetical protein DITRI_Ditri02bG0024600 [Diplodiscus trichospermus]